MLLFFAFVKAQHAEIIALQGLFHLQVRCAAWRLQLAWTPQS